MAKNIPLTIVIAIAVVIGAAGFYGGFTYGKRKGGFNPANFQNMTPEQRQQLFQSGGFNRGNRTGGGGGNRAGGGFTAGEIISKNDTSITIKANDGGSKIVFISPSTEVMKNASGTLADLATGENVTVNGTANQDGSITAKTVQIRPNAPIGFGPGGANNTGGQPGQIGQQ